jgi:hypothetical protein
MILQLGMVLLFGMVFPLIPLIATINNLFFLRLDASKLMYTRKRYLNDLYVCTFVTV